MRMLFHPVSVVYTIGYFLLLSSNEKLKISESIFKYFRRAQKRRLMSWRKQADMLGEVQKSGGVRKWPWDSRPAVPLLDCNTNCHINYFEQKSQVWACISWTIVIVDVDKHLLTSLIIAGLNEKEWTKTWLSHHTIFSLSYAINKKWKWSENIAIIKNILL